jgi:IS5 family transposase
MLSLRKRKDTYLDKIDKIIDWGRIKRILDKKYKWTKNAAGNPAYPPLPMFKILLVERWEKLSDEQMEFALRDRFSIIRFVGFSVMSDTPDYSTISRFRNRLLELKIYDRLFDEINKQLIKKGFIVRERAGAIVDATVIESANRPCKVITNIPEDRKEDDAETDEMDKIEPGEKANKKDSKPGSNKPLEETSHFGIEYSADPDARWLKKGNHSYFGYKGFAGANVDGFIINGLMTPANVSEVNKFYDILEILNLLPNTPVLADKGYSSDKNRKILTDLGLKDFIMQKAARGRKLTEYQKMINKGISKIRYVVEQVFGILKKHYHFDRCRYRGLKKVNMEFKLVSMAYNLKKAAGMVI